MTTTLDARPGLAGWLGARPATPLALPVFTFTIFQSALLAGYAYAHALTRWFDARIAALVHLSLMVVVLGAGLPIAFGSGWGTPPEHGQALRLIGVVTVSVGLPFFAVSANGPLLQAWFARTVVGDGRLTLALAQEQGGYGLIMLDAFSSSSPPVHLLTREAVAMYASKLSPDGVLIFNISNRNMVLSHVVAASAREAGLVTWHRSDDPRKTGAFKEALKVPVEVAIAARRPADIGAIAGDPAWKQAEVPADFRVWTDDFSNILDPLRRKLGW
jgi:hypothetical protein